jgi:hypothetical protein
MCVGNRSPAAADPNMNNDSMAMDLMADAASRSEGAQPRTDAS